MLFFKTPTELTSEEIAANADASKRAWDRANREKRNADNRAYRKLHKDRLSMKEKQQRSESAKARAVKRLAEIKAGTWKPVHRRAARDIRHVFHAYLDGLGLKTVRHSVIGTETRVDVIGLVTPNPDQTLEMIAATLSSARDIARSAADNFSHDDIELMNELERAMKRHEYEGRTQTLYFPWVVFNAFAMFHNPLVTEDA